MMYDATGQRIFRHDLVMFEKTTGAEHDRGLVVSLGKTDIIVVLVDGSEVEKKPCDLTVVDRSFLCPGMAVALVSDCSAQPGVITGVATKLDLVQLDANDRPRVVATGVSPAEVWPVRELTRGDYVVSGMWLGRVVEVSVDVDVLFNDGTAVCRVTNAGDNKLRVVSKKSYWNRHKDGFYPGDGVAGDASVLKASRWIKGHWKPSHGEGIVAKVEMGGVLVYWAASLQNASSPPPAYHPNPCNLTFLCPGGTDLRWSWCVSAHCYFRSRSPAKAPKKKHRRNSNGILIRMAKVKRADRRLTGVKWPMAVANTRTTVDVPWQDGTRQLGVPSASLLGLPLRSQKDFFPGHRVVSKVLSPTPTIADVTNATSRVGVIKSLSSKDQTVLLHEIAIVKPRNVDVILREMGDWVSDDDEGEDDAFHKKAQEDMPRHRPAPTDNTIGKLCNIFLAVIRTLSGMVVQGKMYMLSKSMASTSSRAEPAMAENIQTCPLRFEAAAASALASHDAGGDDVFHFKHFDVVQSPRDHHYLDTNEQGGCGGRKWLKRVQKEWKILETSLPDTIYVRGFEDRMDLLRAAMVGASGTPYHDGLFFFDLHLPPSYPAAPPQVKYHSFGLHANPNLYPSGTVCLSLLNTFGGKGTELWSPESSSLLQVVVSIQGLVLTAQPYYNEANYAAQAGTPEGRRNELPYCENTYLVNLHTMLYLIRRPPVGFEMFVRDHFCRRGQHVLRACEAYLHEGCPVGTLDGEAIATETSKDRSCSVGFKLALANVVPRLVEAFTEVGARTSNEVDRM
ncbi:unnamed protein product [Urochloa decumbens]|uniref:UBC core domain-containing protein n=1 Tax=Urochloa decumbens TaxID=240449 RepID=A0ABC9GF90_9POAL